MNTNTIREAVKMCGDEWIHWYVMSDNVFRMYLDTAWEDQKTMRKHGLWRSRGFTPAERIYWFDDL